MQAEEWSRTWRKMWSRGKVFLRHKELDHQHTNKGSGQCRREEEIAGAMLFRGQKGMGSVHKRLAWLGTLNQLFIVTGGKIN